MITGRQIRKARMMLGWTRDELCKRADVEINVLARAEAVDHTPGITLAQGGRVQLACERAGIRFGRNGAVLMPMREQP